MSFTALPIQEKLFDIARDGRYRIIGFGGGIRSSKTFGTIGLLFTLCRLFPKSRWAIVRKDLPTLRRNTVPSINKLVADHFAGFVGELNQSDWTYTCTNGSQVILFPESLDIDPDLSRWKGLEVNGFDLEESDELAERSFHKAIERSGSWIVPSGGVQPPPYVFCTFNPCANWPKHVFYEPWQQGTIAAPYAFIPATAADNDYIPDTTRESWKSLPEQEYRRFVEGDWSVLSGRYYGAIHPLIPRTRLPKELPDYWTYWGAFDWGYAHWAVFGAFAQDTDGNAYLLDSCWMRQEQDEEMAATIKAAMPVKCIRPVYAGHDCWHQGQARGASGVSTFEVFAKAGIAMVQADIDKVNGGRATRRALHFTRSDDGTLTKAPRIYIVDTPGNKRIYEQLATIMPDENNVNKPAKMDADSEGRGGDDGADMFRYGIASHPPLAKDTTPRYVDADDRSPAIDWKHGGRIHRVTAEEEIDKVLGIAARTQTRQATRRPRW